MNEDHDIMPVPKLDCQLSLCMLQSYLIFVTYITYGTGEEMPKSHSQTHTNDQLCIFSNSKFSQLELEARHWCVYKKWTNTLEVDFQSLGVVSWGEDVSLFCPVFYAAMMTRILSQGRPQKPGYGVVVENITGRGRVKGGSKWQKVWEGGGSTPEGTEGGGLESHQVVCKCWSPTSTGRVPLYQLLFNRTDVAFSSRLEK